MRRLVIGTVPSRATAGAALRVTLLGFLAAGAIVAVSVFSACSSTGSSATGCPTSTSGADAGTGETDGGCVPSPAGPSGGW